jgi:hypothetical protein
VRRAALVLALGLLAGCARDPWSFDKAGITPAQLDQDLESCRRQAQRPYAIALTRSGRIDREALNRCMERKGYTAHRDD